MNLPAGSELRAFVAMFLTSRNGKIVSSAKLRLLPALRCTKRVFTRAGIVAPAICVAGMLVGV